MFLIIPIIEIRDGQAVRQVQGVEGALYSTDPAALARIWRKENAKVLHVVDKDSLSCGYSKNIDAIRAIARAVDIPIEVSGGFCEYEQYEELFNAGVFRVTVNAIGTSDAVVRQLLDKYMPQRVVGGFIAVAGKVLTAMAEPTETTAIDLGMRLKSCGISRVIYREIEIQSRSYVIDRETLKSFAQKTQLRVTTAGSVQNVQELWKIQELEQYGVDSILMGKSLYENRFPCQQLWRLVEAEELSAIAHAARNENVS